MYIFHIPQSKINIVCTMMFDLFLFVRKKNFFGKWPTLWRSVVVNSSLAVIHSSISTLLSPFLLSKQQKTECESCQHTLTVFYPATRMMLLRFLIVLRTEEWRVSIIQKQTYVKPMTVRKIRLIETHTTSFFVLDIQMLTTLRKLIKYINAFEFFCRIWDKDVWEKTLK